MYSFPHTICRFSRSLSALIFFSVIAFNVSAQTKNTSIQIAAYVTAGEAQDEVNRLKSRGMDAFYVKAEIPKIGTRYRVRVGRYADDTEAMLGAAKACTTATFSQFLVVTGDAISATRTCNAAFSFARNNRAKEIAPQVAVVTKPAPTSVISKAPEPRIVASAPQPNVTPAAVKPAPPVQIAEVKPEPKATTAPAINPAPNSAMSREDRPRIVIKQKPSSTNVAIPVAATPPLSKSVGGSGFVPAHRPSDIVTNAYQYAVSILPKPISLNKKNEIAPAKIAASGGVIAPVLNSETAVNTARWQLSDAKESEKNLRAVYFSDAWNGWAAGDGGTLLHTVDGGKEWNPLRGSVGKNYDAQRIFFMNENRGWMLGEMRDKTSNEASSVLMATEDGGQIWQHIALPNVTSFFFVNEKNGYAVGRKATLLKSNDGGLQWKAVENLTPLISAGSESDSLSFGFSDVYFMNKEVGWAIGNFYGRNSSIVGALLMTTDSGENWQRIPLTFQRKNKTTGAARGALRSVRFNDVNNGIVTGEIEEGGENYFITLKTRDGGESWEQMRVPAVGSHHSQFVDAARGWTAATTVRDSSTDARIYDTILLRTENGGKSWETDFVARGKQVRSMFFISPNRGWAVGDQGMILRYESQ
jgi:photosystem II stability/assembly factor-like uncharacterized protein